MRYKCYKPKTDPMIYQTNCIASTAEDIHAMLDAETSITRRTFLSYVDRDSLQQVETSLGYARHPSQGLTMAGDWHVSYAKSTFRGRPCVFFTWSAIEHVFTCNGHV